MAILDSVQLDKKLLNSKVIQNSINGPKVVILSNGQYLKFFRLKTWFSSALFYHYANRFINNCYKLKKYNIDTVDITDIFIISRCSSLICSSRLTKAVQYKPLEGITFRDLIANNQVTEEVINDFAKFVAKLHNLGIYFKALHFGNIIYNSNIIDKFGLIDIDNMQFYHKPLRVQAINKNFMHMRRYIVDSDWLKENNVKFYQSYIEAIDLRPDDIDNLNQ